MRRSLVVWLVFTACALTGLAVLAWFSLEMIRLERGAAQAREIAAREETVRLALWRMDSALASIHGLEAARPPAEYAPFVPAAKAFSADLVPNEDESLLIPSPLLGFAPPFVRLHVQLDWSGQLTSPQVPEGPARLAALRAGLALKNLNTASARLNQLRREPTARALMSALERGAPPAEWETARFEASDDARSASARPNTATPTQSLASAPAEPAIAQQLAPQAERQASVELRKSQAEQQQRAELAGENYYTLNRAPSQRARKLESVSSLSSEAQRATGATSSRQEVAGEDRAFADSETSGAQATAAEAAPAAAPTMPAAAVDMDSDVMADASGTPMEAGPLQVAWVEGELFLVRQIDGGSAIRAQAVWLDWPELRAWLLARISDLLPGAELEPVPDVLPSTAEDAARRLAFLPVRLRAGPTTAIDPAVWSPLRSSLALAWSLAAVGVAALALLLAGTLRLSERRGAFVSAVTHELRTPLTTFRMYTEMLSSGMVPDEARRRSYLDTLRKEAERLAHLVENVLSYARLERGRASRRVEETTPGDLFARIEERLRLRAEQGGLTLGVAFEPGAEAMPLHTDTTAFEQIVFNLVDNAAKYARRTDGAGALEIRVAAGARGRLVVRVSDNGPGIAASVRKRLFQPFTKSAAEAAHSQPGVGLGLALSRRLARDELHGELALERTGPDGTVFRLEV